MKQKEVISETKYKHMATSCKVDMKEKNIFIDLLD